MTISRKAIIHCALSTLLAAYLVVALLYSAGEAAADTCKGLRIEVVDSIQRGFVTGDDIDAELGSLSSRITALGRDSVNTLEIERRIMAMDNIEKASCTYLNDGSLRIKVTPLLPIARVFDTKGEDFYINRDGKRMAANTRYRIDTPVIVGDFNPNRTPAICFPLLEYLAEHPDIASLVSAMEVRRNKDIIIVPRIKGHVVNIGDTRDLDNKFDRLLVFYRKVLPAKGWEHYDTISVKWRRQVVAHRSRAKVADKVPIVEEHDDIDDIGTITTN